LSEFWSVGEQLGNIVMQTEPHLDWDDFWRRRRVCGLFVLTLPLFFLYGILVAAIHSDPDGAQAAVLIGPMFLIIPAWFITYVVLYFRVLLWRCPQCGGCFCWGWFIAWPIAKTCVNCGLAAPDKMA
jgi:hypothetical protein